MTNEDWQSEWPALVPHFVNLATNPKVPKFHPCAVASAMIAAGEIVLSGKIGPEAAMAALIAAVEHVEMDSPGIAQRCADQLAQAAAVDPKLVN